MKSYSDGRNLYGSLTKNTNSVNLLLGDQVANDDYRAICSARDWPFLERTRALLTQASTQFVNLPYDCEQVKELSVIVSTKTYTPRMAPDKMYWDKLNQSLQRSDIPQWWFSYAGQVGLWPVPVNSGNTINISQKTRVIDLSVADYSTGNIVSVANGGTAVVGSGTGWTSQMVGRYIRITYSDTTNTGDGQWYEIAGVSSATALTLVRAYGGLTISAGSAAYKIGQMPLLPEAYHDLPWLYASGVYWEKESDDRGPAMLARHGSFGENGGLPTGRIKQLVTAWSSPNTSMVIDDGDDREIINPNLTVTL